MLSFASFTLVGQTKAEQRKQNRADKKEQKMLAKQNPHTDMAKVGKHLKNMGWSMLGAAITVPYAAAGLISDERDLMSQGPSQEYDALDVVAQQGLLFTGAFCVFNSGAQAIKAGWELMKGQKKE